MNKRLFLFSICLLLLPSVAQANAGAVFDAYSHAIGPITENPLVMDREAITFTISPTIEEDDDMSGKAHATFWMQNPTDQDIQTSSAFPLSYDVPTDFLPEVRTYALEQDISVTIDDVTVPGEIKNTTILINGSNGLQPTDAFGYVFPLVVKAHQTAKLDVYYDYPYFSETFPESLDFEYVVATGAGWAGSIRSATFSIVYPYSGIWSEARQESDTFLTGTVSGNTTTYTLQQFEPSTESDIVFEVTAPKLAREFLDAEKNVYAHPADQAAYERFTKAYYAIPLPIGQYESALHVIESRYGSVTAPETGEAVLELARLYSNDWTASYCGIECDHLFHKDALEQLLTYAETHSWNESDMSALTELRSRLESASMKGSIAPETFAFLPGESTTTGTDIVTDTEQPAWEVATPTHARMRQNMDIALAQLIAFILSIILLAVLLTHSLTDQKQRK